jgi:hypothetical protein
MMFVGSARPGVATPTERLAFRIAAWLALAIIYAVAFHYAKKYEADMLTGSFSNDMVRTG